MSGDGGPGYESSRGGLYVCTSYTQDATGRVPRGGARQANKASQARSDGQKSCESGVAGYQALC